jgi:hypothetical protein
MNTQQIWVLIGQLAAALGCLWTVIQIFNFFSAKNEALVATIEHNDFRIPFAVFDELNKGNKPDHFSNRQIFQRFSSLRSQYKITIENRSKKACRDISILIPGGIYAQLEYENGTKDTLEFNKQIDISVLNPKTSITLVVWAEYGLSLFGKINIKITHSAGTAKIKAVKKLSKDLYTILSLFPVLTILLCFLIPSTPSKNTSDEASQQILHELQPSPTTNSTNILLVIKGPDTNAYPSK